MASLTFLGNPIKTCGQFPKVGEAAPTFTVLHTSTNSNVDTKTVFGNGKITVISFFPSIDTPVCSKQTKEFVHSKLIKENNVQLMNISMDLQFAQARHAQECGAVDASTYYTDHVLAEFGTKYGVLLPDLRLLARGTAIVDKEGKLAYLQVCDEVTHDVDFAGLYKKLEEIVKA